MENLSNFLRSIKSPACFLRVWREGKYGASQSPGILCGEIDQFVLFQRIRGIDDDAVRRIDPLKHFQGIAKIPPDRDFLRLIRLSGPTTAAIVPSGRNRSALIGRERRWPVTLTSKCTSAYDPGKRVPEAFRDVHFGQEGSSVGINGVRRYARPAHRNSAAPVPSARGRPSARDGWKENTTAAQPHRRASGQSAPNRTSLWWPSRHCRH